MTKSLPGQRDVRTVTPRRFLLRDEGAVFESITIDATYAYDGANTDKEDELRAGTPMARITSSGLWVPCKRTTVVAGGSGSGTGAGSSVIPVVDARAFRAGDTISVGGDTGLTVSAVDYSANTITVSDPAFSYDTGEAVIASGDLAGAETCRGFLNGLVKLKDPDGTWRDKQTGDLVVAGYCDDGVVLGDLAAIRADAAAKIDHIIWKDEQTGT